MSEASKKSFEKAPSDECVEYNYFDYEVNADKTYLGEYNENNVPDDCKNNKNTCEFKFIGFNQISDASYNKSEKKLAVAEGVAFNTIQQLFPKTRQDCEDNYCLAFNSNEDENNVHFTSSITLPIYSLLGKKITINSSSYRAKEKL